MAELFTQPLKSFQNFHAYWDKLRQDAGGIPSRLQFNPGAVKPLLPYISLLEVRPPDELHVRLAGTALDVIAGGPLTGRNYLETCHPEQRDAYMETATVMVGHPCGMVHKRHASFPDGTSQLVASMNLPMKDREGRPRYIIGIAAAQADYEPVNKPTGELISVKLFSADYIDLGYGLPPETPFRMHPAAAND